MSTQFPSKNGIARQWHVLDAEDVVLGKLASKAAMLLMGKHKATFTPFLDTGDHVVVVNAAKVRLTGRKDDNKVYRHFTGYPGGLVETSARRVRADAARPHDRGSHSGHAPQDQARQADVSQAEGLRGRQASACGAETRPALALK